MFTGTIIFCIFIAICIIVGALIIQLSTNMAAGFKPSLGNAIATVIVGIIAGIIASIVLRMLLGDTGSLIGLVVSFLVNAFIINLMVKPSPTTQMGFGKACLVSLIQYVIYIVLTVITFFVVGSAIFSMLGGAH